MTGNKTDVTDARAIWLAVQQPDVKFVGMKTAEQQATLTLHRQRELLMKMRNMQSNALRGLLYEFGAIFAKGQRALLTELEPALESLSAQLPQMVADSLREQLQRIKALGEDIARIDKRLALQLRADAQMRRIAQIPGVGVLSATAAIATMGQASAFKSGREFCAWLGLVPGQRGTGGKVRLGNISKRGDTYLRTLLVNGARAVVGRSAHNSWLERLLQRRHFNVVVAALANKMARTAWAVLAKGKAFDPLKWNPTEAAAT